MEPTDERLPLLRRALGAGNKNANVYLASPQNAANLFDAVAGRPTVFARELGQFLDAGYKQVGNLLHDAAIRIGMDPREAFDQVLQYATKSVESSLVRFLTRSKEDKSIEAMGYVAAADGDGFRYERTW